MKESDHEHIHAHNSKSYEVSPDSRCRQGKDFRCWIQEDVGKHVRYCKSQKGRDCTDDDSSLKPETFNRVNSIVQSGAVIDGNDRLGSLIDSVAQTSHNNGCVGDNTIHADSDIPHVFQNLQIEYKHDKPGQDF